MSYFDVIWNLGRYNFLKEIIKDKERFDNIIYQYYLTDSSDIFKIEYTKALLDLLADIAWNIVTPWFEIDGAYGDKNMTIDNPDYYKFDINYIKTFILPYKDEWKDNLIKSKINKIENAKQLNGNNEDFKSDYKIWDEIKEQFNIPNNLQKTESNDKLIEKHRAHIFTYFAANSFNLSVPITGFFFNPTSTMIRNRVDAWMTQNNKIFNSFTDSTSVKAGFNTDYLVSQLEKQGQYRGEEFGSIFDKDDEILNKLLATYNKYNTVFGKVSMEYNLNIDRVKHGSIGSVVSLLLTCCCCCLILIILIL